MDQFPAGIGPFGTYDQCGNCWEWCEDAYDSQAYLKRIYKQQRQDDPKALRLDSVLDYKVIRGALDMPTKGVCRREAKLNHVTSSSSHIASNYFYIGFRCGG